jgi:hypothetical protein
LTPTNKMTNEPAREEIKDETHEVQEEEQEDLKVSTISVILYKKKKNDGFSLVVSDAYVSTIAS